MNKLKVEYVKVGELQTYPNNAKVHTADQIEQIKASIEQFGFNDPIGVWKDNEIIEGHGRLIAAQELGIDQVPVIRLDNLTDEERRAYMLVHNQLTMNTGFDFALLEIELDDINIDMGKFGFEDVTPFDENMLDDLFEDAEEEEREPKKIQCPHCGEWFEQ